MRVKTIFYLIIILGILSQNCASFDKKVINPNPLNKEKLSELNGRYGIVHNKFDSILNHRKEGYNKQIWNYNNFITEIDRKLIRDTLNLDTLKTYAFDLKILSPKRIKIDYIENGKIIKKRILKTKLKRDGYLYLRNKNTQFMLVPFLAGAIDIKRTRLTKSDAENLIFDVANYRYGAALIIIGDTRTWKYRQEYKRMK